MSTSSKGSNPDGSKNKMENSSGKGWSPPSGKQNPPGAGAHTPKDTHRIKGDEDGGQAAGVHHSLKKPGLMK